MAATDFVKAVMASTSSYAFALRASLSNALSDASARSSTFSALSENDTGAKAYSLLNCVMASGRKRIAVIHEGPDAARRCEGTMDRLLRVSKEELARREAEYQESRKNKPRHEPKAGER